jgi:hypothetical protein
MCCTCELNNNQLALLRTLCEIAPQDGGENGGTTCHTAGVNFVKMVHDTVRIKLPWRGLCRGGNQGKGGPPLRQQSIARTKISFLNCMTDVNQVSV